MRCVTKQELMELLADLSGEYSDIANCWVRVKDAADTIRALADRPEPAQPVALRVDLIDMYVNKANILASDAPHIVVAKLQAVIDAAPPSHPAPSEAAPERQDGRTLLAATALVQWWERAKNPPLPVDWNAHLGRLQEDLMAAVNAKPAKGEGKP